ncbi:phosphate uptake regulator PhoU [Candidatus Micrarchaeota archaeon]|nr:phosphate uptake regulator PhoU [Candidatus Micrarchaeota archaeon]
MENIRRVQKTGGSTFTVSLPKKWAEARGLNAGSPAYVWENPDGSLTMRTSRKTVRETRLVNTGTDEENALRHVIAAYVSGVDTLIVKGALAAAVSEEARLRLSALEIMEVAGDEVKLQVFHKGEVFTTDKSIRRLYSVVLAMFDSANAFFEGRVMGLEEIRRREQEADRLYFLVLRSAHKEEGSLHDALNKTLAAKTLEDIADMLELACEEGKSIAPNPNVLKLLNDAESVYRSGFEALFLRKHFEKGFVAVKQLEEKLERATESLMKDGRKAGHAIAMKGVLERLQAITEYSEDLMEIGSNLIEFKEEGHSSPLKQ